MCGTKCGKRGGSSEWQLANFGLQYEDPSCFVLSMWCGPSRAYLIYRWVWAVFFLSMLVLSLVENKEGAKWLIWFTYWGYLVLTINICLQALTVTHHYWVARKPGDVIHTSMPVIYRIIWVLNTITITTAPIITAIYWAVVYNGQKVGAVTVTTHWMNVIYVTLDMTITGIPIRILHAYQPMIFGAIYSLFTAIYWAMGGTTAKGKPYIYSILDYANEPEMAIACVLLMVFLVVPLIVLIWWSVYKAKLWMLTYCARRQVVEITGHENRAYVNEVQSTTAQLESHMV